MNYLYFFVDYINAKFTELFNLLLCADLNFYLFLTHRFMKITFDY